MRTAARRHGGTAARSRRFGGAAGLFAFLLLSGIFSGCREDLTAPADCPELCPSGQAEVLDLILNPLAGSDSSYGPYVEPGAGNAILVSNGLPAAETRGVFRFVARPDSVIVASDTLPYVIDSVLLSFGLLARDTLTDGLKVFLYRLPATVDAGITFDDVNPLLVEANIIDSIVVSDSLNTGRVNTVLSGDELAKVDIPVGTGGTLAVGLAITANQPTGIRVGSAIGGTGASFTTYTTVDVADTSMRDQTILRAAAFNTFVTQTQPATDTTLLTVGGTPSSRALLRFDLPEPVEDSATIIRATLELVPLGPILGLPTSPDTLRATSVLADLGAKSPLTEEPTFIAFDTISPGTADTVKLDVTRLVQLWQSDNELPEAIFLSLRPEGASFTRAEFGSTRRPDVGAPRLRITYQRPFPFENP